MEADLTAAWLISMLPSDINIQIDFPSDPFPSLQIFFCIRISSGSAASC